MRKFPAVKRNPENDFHLFLLSLKQHLLKLGYTINFTFYHKSRKTPSFSYGDISDPASSPKAGYKLLPSLH